MFGSQEGYEEAFTRGLRRLLRGANDHASRVVFLANYLANPCVRAQISEKELTSAIAACDVNYQQGQAAGISLASPPRGEDLAIFAAAKKVGVGQLALMLERPVGRFIATYHPLREFRPQRMSSGPVGSLFRPFSAREFNFLRPEVARECFWRRSLGGETARVLYNKYPFAPLHSLLVPSPGARLPQYLTPRWHFWLWDLVETIGRGIPGVVVIYNSIGGGASVNHLHFQLMIGDWPVTDRRWCHNGGSEDYPAACKMLLREEAEGWLELVNQQGVAYGLLYFPGRVYAFARREFGTYPASLTTAGVAAGELGGRFVALNQASFNTLMEEELAKELAAVSLTL